MGREGAKGNVAHVPARWRAVSCEGEPDKGEGLS